MNIISSPVNMYYNKFSLSPVRNKVYFGMDEDIFATERNGHLLRDTFDKSSNSLDIRSNGLYPANVLSNLAHNEFEIDGVKCASIEGFLQSLKIEDEDKQKEVCSMYGGTAKKTGQKFDAWKINNTLYWKGRKIDRTSSEFYDLVLAAYKACYEQNSVFKTALDSTKGKKLTHNSGREEPSETVLTKEEFISFLNNLREN